jgi:UDP-N-acetylmuramate--alanine ligase
MSGIAEVLLNLGYRVSGSDLKETEITAVYIIVGGKIAYGHKRSIFKGLRLSSPSAAAGQS